MFKVSIIIGLGYVFLMLMAFSFDPIKKYYHRLFERPTFIFHFILAVFLLFFGLYRIKYFDIREVGYFIPILFLIFFRLLDSIIFKAEGRHIIVVTRGDEQPSEYKWWIDGIFTVLSALIPFLLSVLILIILRKNPGIIGGQYKDVIKIHPVSNN